MRALHQRYTLSPVLILLIIVSGYSQQLQAVSYTKVGSGKSAGAQGESDTYCRWNNWGNTLALYKTRKQAATTKTDHPSGTIIVSDTGNNVLMFGDWDTGTIQQLSGGQLGVYFSNQEHDLGFIRDIQMIGETAYVSSVERQQEYQMLSRITGGILDNQWLGLAGGIGILPLSHKQLLSGGTGRMIFPYKVNSSLSLPASPSFPSYAGKSAIKFARNSKGDVYILDVIEGVLYKVECNADGICDWQDTITLSKDYPRAVQMAVDEQDRIVLGVAGVEFEPASIPPNNESRIVLLEDVGQEARLLDAKSDKSIRLWFGPRGGLIAANGEVDFISTSDSKDTIVRLVYSDRFGEPEILLSTDKTLSGLAVRARH